MTKERIHLSIVGLLFAIAAPSALASPMWIIPTADLSDWPFNLLLIALACCAALALGVVATRARAATPAFFVACSINLCVAWFAYVQVLLSNLSDVLIVRAGLFETQMMFVLHVLVIQAFLAGGLLFQGSIGSRLSKSDALT